MKIFASPMFKGKAKNAHDDDIDKNRLSDSEIKKLCEEKGCHCPPINEVRQAIVETPLYLREYFEEIGRKKCKQR